MNIYFSCSITGGRQDQAVYQAIVAYLLAAGYEVPTAHLAEKDIMAAEVLEEPRAVYLRDVHWVENCDALIAEVSTPSHGVGYEIALALQLGKPVLCCHRHGRRVSKMISGNTSPSMQFAAYQTTSDAVEVVKKFLSGIQGGKD